MALYQLNHWHKFEFPNLLKTARSIIDTPPHLCHGFLLTHLLCPLDLQITSATVRKPVLKICQQKHMTASSTQSELDFNTEQLKISQTKFQITMSLSQATFSNLENSLLPSTVTLMRKIWHF